MTSVPASIAAEIQLNRQNIALSVIKQSAEQDQALAQILDDATRTAPINASRGANVNISA